jgi:hypothetical protein
MLQDPLVTVFSTFGHLNSIPVSPSLSTVPYDEYPNAIAEHVEHSGTQLVVIPWSSGHHLVPHESPRHEAHNPFESIFHRATSQDPTSSIVYSEFVRKVFLNARADVALFVDRVKTSAKPRHLLVPFFGGPDDRLALSFVVQLCMNKDARATVLRLNKIDTLSPNMTNSTVGELPKAHLSSGNTQPDIIHQSMAAADTHYGEITPQHKLVSDTADNLQWDKYARKGTVDPAELDALSRITFVTKGSPQLLHTVAEETTNLVNAGNDVIVVLGRSRTMALESHAAELREVIKEHASPIGASLAKTLGDVGAAQVVMNVHASLLVMQTRRA